MDLQWFIKFEWSGEDVAAHDNGDDGVDGHADSGAEFSPSFIVLDRWEWAGREEDVIWAYEGHVQYALQRSYSMPINKTNKVW